MTRTFLPHVITDDSALGGAVIERSLRFSATASPKLTRTFGTNTSNTTKTISFWMKRGSLGSTEGMQNIFCTALSGYIEGRLRINTDDTLQFEDRDASGGTSDGRRQTSAKLRDTSSWYHIILALDSTQGTEADRAKIYINGTQATISADRTISQNYSFSFMRSSAENYVGEGTNEGSHLDAYLAEVNFIDGQQLDPSYFGFTDSQTGMWMPKRYEGTYGNNGFHLEFKDNSSTSTLGKDTSGNGNDFTANGFSVTAGKDDDSMIDTPTNNFPTFNLSNRSTQPTISNGNLRMYYNYKPATKTTRATFRLPKSGKFYYEWQNEESSSNPGRWQSTIGNVVDIATNSVDINAANNANFVSYSYGGSIWNGTTHVSASWDGTTRSWYSPERAAWAVDCDTGNIWLGRVASDGTTQWWASDGSATGNPSKFLNPTCAIDKDKSHEYAPIACWHDGGAAVSTGFAININFGQHSFLGTIPDGFKTLSSTNIQPDPTINTIVRPQKHFDIVLYTGDEATSRKISGLEFQPDLVWIKPRSTTSNHCLLDSVRGVHNRILPNSSGANVNNTSTITAFNVDGFQIGNSSLLNTNSATHVAWCWKAGGNSNTFNIDGVGYATAAAAGLDGGTANPTGASVNTEAGFSIVQFEAQTTSTDITLSHGLGKKPEFWMWKSVDNNINWYNYHKSIGYNGWANNSTTSAATTGNDAAWKAEPTSTVFTHGSGLMNQNTIIMYMWTSIPGFSKFGSYEGNNNADRPYIHLGFRPAWVMIKNIDAGSTEWYILDSARDTYNPVGQYLSSSSSASEATYIFYDFLSNGFKLRNTGSAQNPSSQTIIYMAFAEAPGTTPFDTFPNAR